MKKLGFLAIALAAAIFLARQPGVAPPEAATSPNVATRPAANAAAADPIAEAFASRRSGVPVQGRGTVTKLLGDDSLGDRHQRFVLELPSGQTVLIAHNIDLAPRLDSLAVGDAVGFSGEYEWNERGGVIHWTHRDPAGQHPGGWLRHRDRTYE